MAGGYDTEHDAGGGEERDDAGRDHLARWQAPRGGEAGRAQRMQRGGEASRLDGQQVVEGHAVGLREWSRDGRLSTYPDRAIQHRSMSHDLTTHQPFWQCDAGHTSTQLG